MQTRGNHQHLCKLEIIRFQPKTLSEFPSDPDVLAESVPVYEELQGWKEPLGGAWHVEFRSFEGDPEYEALRLLMTVR